MDNGRHSARLVTGFLLVGLWLYFFGEESGFYRNFERQADCNAFLRCVEPLPMLEESWLPEPNCCTKTIGITKGFSRDWNS